MTGLLDAPVPGAEPRGAAPRVRPSAWARWRVAVRLARRQVRRAWVSSLLVATLVALPIAGMTAFLVYSMSLVATPEERTAVELGQMQAWVKPAGVPGHGFWQVPSEPEWTGYPSDDDGAMTIPDGAALDDPSELLPTGTEIIPVSKGAVSVVTPDGSAVLAAWAGSAWDPRFAGAFDLVAGERADTAREAMVSPAALERLGIEIGDEVHLADGGPVYTVTGTLKSAVLADAALFLPESAQQLVGGRQQWYLPALALSWADVQRLNDEGGLVVYSRAVALDPPAFSNRFYSAASTDRWARMWPTILILSVAAVFAGYVVVMLAGAAFAVAARRQQRALAIAASVGADRRDLSRIVLLQGAVLGLVGGTVGVAAGVGLAAAVLAATADGRATMFWGFHVPWELLAAVLGFAVAVGTLSALMPSRTVARSPALQALRGARRPQKPVASRPVWGSVLMIAGVAITIASAFIVAAINTTGSIGYDSPLRYVPAYGIVVGPILAQFGVLLSGGWLLWVCSRMLSRVGTAAKLASRDAAANASRTIPAFAAIAATVFVGVFAVAQSSMQTAQTARSWYYDAPLGSIAIPIWAGTASNTGMTDPAEAQAGAAAAVQIARDAGAERAAVVSRQQPAVWSYRSAAQVPDDLTFTIAVLPERHLQDPDVEDSYTSFGQDPSNPISVVPVRDVESALGLELSASQLDAYRDGAALVVDERFVTGGALEVETFTGADMYDARVPDNIWQRRPADPRPADPVRAERLDAVVVSAPRQPIAIAVAPATAQRLGMTVQPERVVAPAPEALTTGERDRMQAQADLLSGAAFTLAPGIEEGPPSDAAWMVPLLGAVVVLVLGASAVALGLARFERRPDDATLAAVGGTPALRRRIGFWQGLIIAGIGTAAGAAAGILPPIGFVIQAGGNQLLTDVPWVVIAGVVVVLPLGIAVANWLVPPRRPELTRRTAIT